MRICLKDLHILTVFPSGCCFIQFEEHDHLLYFTAFFRGTTILNSNLISCPLFLPSLCFRLTAAAAAKANINLN